MFVKLSRATCDSLDDFVDYWEQFYEGPEQHSDAEFLAHLKWKGGRLTAGDVKYLFGWKYRPVPSWDPKPVIKRLRELNELRFKDNHAVAEFARTFSKGGLVKRYFICHITSPRKYPLWDQYVLRAHLLISGRGEEIDHADELIHDEAEYESYRTGFNQWVTQVPDKVEDVVEFPSFRRLDRALFAMGKASRIVLRSE
jgi:hypothetical protein